jgi:hypothetical protein
MLECDFTGMGKIRRLKNRFYLMVSTILLRFIVAIEHLRPNAAGNAIGFAGTAYSLFFNPMHRPMNWNN